MTMSQIEGQAKPVIAVIGGTGKEGSGLGFRWACAGFPVILGSRSAERAAAMAAELNALLPAQGRPIEGAGSREAVARAAVVVLAVPYSGQREQADALRDLLEGKILIDVTVPLVPPRVNRAQLPEGGSAVEALQKHLGGAVKVVSAFQNVSATHLRDPAFRIDCDVLVCSDDAQARETVVGLAQAAGFTAWQAGPLANSAAAEALTSVLIAINKRYKVPAAGIRITGLARPAEPR
jgi:8-hydroxy-5-deazaflavin:NADPH oxidoreductase